jgi:probable F420-dependent oxidoreductase
MKIGLNLINFGPAATPANLRGWVNAAEGLGFDSLFTSDHIATTPDVADRYPAPFYEPLSTLGWLAGVTERVNIGTTVAIVPYRSPLETARAMADIDQLSGGRLIFGVGSGWASQEFDALGVPFHQRGAITDEYLDAIIALWTQDTASFEGQFVSFDSVSTAPRPAQTPHPPIWVGGSSPAAFRRIARFGQAWHPIRLRLSWLTGKGIPRLRDAAEQANRAMPAICPRIGFRLTDAPMAEDSRLMGEGTLDQVLGDLAELEALECEHVILDTSYETTDHTLDPQGAWRDLELVARALSRH